MRSRARRAVFALSLALLVATGCFRTTLGEVRDARAERTDVWLHQFLFGLVGAAQIDVRNECTSGAASVGVSENAATFAVTLVTLGIYTPHIAHVACAPGPGSAP